MMRSIGFDHVQRFTRGHENPHHNIVIWYRRRKIELEHGAGSSDQIKVYREGCRVYVISIDTRHDSVGLDYFDLQTDPEPLDTYYDGIVQTLRSSGEVFCDGDERVIEHLGKRGLDLAPHSMVRRLSEYLGGQ